MSSPWSAWIARNTLRRIGLVLVLVGLAQPGQHQANGRVQAHANLPAGLNASDWTAIIQQLPVTQQAFVKASNTNSGDNFGNTVAIDGDTIVIGAPFEASAATGVNGNQQDNSAWGAGAVYIFVRTDTTWTQQAYLKASNTTGTQYFGEAVAISGDTIVVGAFGESSAATGVNGDQTDTSAFDAGAAYVFVRTGTTWSQQAYLKASNTQTEDFFGSRVAIAGDTIVVGAPQEDSAAPGVNGNQQDNTAPTAGAAYVFVRTGTTWSQQAYLKASNTNTEDEFGTALDIAGDTIVVAAKSEDSAATGVNGNQQDNSAPDAGAAYVFVRTGPAGTPTWSQQAYLKASNTQFGDAFGGSVALDGDTILVGAPYEASAATGVNGDQQDNSVDAAGAAYVFVRMNDVSGAPAWSQQAYLKSAYSQYQGWFGSSAAISGDMVIVGAFFENPNAIYPFVRNNTTWTPQDQVTPAVIDDDGFGHTVALADDTIVVGAPRESSAATGIDGDQTDNSAESAGAAYIFEPTLFSVYLPVVLGSP